MTSLNFLTAIVFVFSLSLSAEQLHPSVKNNDGAEDIKGSIIEPTPEQKAQLEEEIKKAKSVSGTTEVAEPGKTKKKLKKKKNKKSKANN